MRALLESVFTLTPAGRNPESFRLYEAIEAGSIPIMVYHDLHQGEQYGLSSFNCREALRYWYDAPIVVLKSWNDLYPTVRTLMEDLEKLDEMQNRLREWYDGFMGRVIRDFEDYD